jgi:hypothetical protein
MDSKYSIGKSTPTPKLGFNNKFAAKRPLAQLKNNTSPKKIKFGPNVSAPNNSPAINLANNTSAIQQHRRQLPVFNIRLR